MPPEGAGNVRVDRARSHTARHRCVNDLKVCGVERSIGKGFAQIKSDKVYDHYGQISDEQIAAGLAGNRSVQQMWTGLYDMYEI